MKTKLALTTLLALVIALAGIGIWVRGNVRLAPEFSKTTTNVLAATVTMPAATTLMPTATLTPVPTQPPTASPTHTRTATSAATTASSTMHAPTLTEATPDTLATIAAMPVPESDLREIAMRLRGHTDIPVIVSTQPAGHRSGDVIEFSATNLDTDVQFNVTAELLYAGPRVLFFAEPHLQVQPAKLRALLEDFEQRIIPTVHEFFGWEWSPGIDGDPRLYILYAEGLGGSVAGYYSSTDEYSRLAHQHSNEKEMFYLNASIITLDDPGLPGTLAHEFQHMVHWANDSNEETWMNEGASVLAELLTGHSSGGFDFVFAADPDLQLNAWSESGGGPESVPHYGAAFLFLDYFLERFGESATRALVAHPANGLAAMDAVLQHLGAVDALSGNPITTDAVFADWVVANYLGDTSLADGRFGYSKYAAAPRVVPTASFGCTAPPGDMSVHQYAADYITIDCPDVTSATFSGVQRVRAVPAGPHSGDFMFWGNRQDSSDSTLTREFDLTQVSGATLTYWAWWALEENYDYAYLVVSSDGGENWQIMHTPGGTDENPSGNNLGWGYHYNSGGAAQPVWVHERVDLSAFAGERILVRFEYLTDAAVNWPGILLDDIAVPEIGYAEDFEAEAGGWDSRGWLRFDNSLPQRWLIQVVDTRTGSVRRVETIDGSADIKLSDRATIVVSALTPYTTETAHYRLVLKSN
ncbi:MAG: immune inhibitor A [Anaerolineales bacterium]|nr:immune inhibitor A [Anaerolineales bacterium]